VERPRCAQCRNPIKDHHVAVTDGERSFHQDCWDETHPAAIVEQVDKQAEYQQRIASEGLAALLSPYVSTMPSQRASAAVRPDSSSVPA
jgi:hypothetical protein